MDAVLHDLKAIVAPKQFMKDVHRTQRLMFRDGAATVAVALSACGHVVSSQRELRKNVEQFIRASDPGAEPGDIVLVDHTSIHISFLPSVVSHFCALTMTNEHLEELLCVSKPPVRRRWNRRCATANAQPLLDGGVDVEAETVVPYMAEPAVPAPIVPLLLPDVEQYYNFSHPELQHM